MRKSVALYASLAVLSAPIIMGQAFAQTGSGTVAPATSPSAAPPANGSMGMPGTNSNTTPEINDSRQAPVGANNNGRDYQKTSGNAGDMHKKHSQHWNSQNNTNGGTAPESSQTGTSMNNEGSNTGTGTGSGTNMGH